MDLSALSLTDWEPIELVLLNRDLFIEITRFCELDQLAAIAATCKKHEEWIFDRHVWWHQVRRLWPAPSGRACRDPRSFCWRLANNSEPRYGGATALRSLDDLVLLVEIVKPGEDALQFEFNVGGLAASTYGEEESTSQYWLPGLPKLTPSFSEAEARLRAVLAAPRHPGDWEEKVNVMLLRKDAFEILGGELGRSYEEVGRVSVALRNWSVRQLENTEAEGNPDTAHGPCSYMTLTLMTFHYMFPGNDLNGWTVEIGHAVYKKTDHVRGYDLEASRPVNRPWKAGFLGQLYRCGM